MTDTLIAHEAKSGVVAAPLAASLLQSPLNCY